MFKDFDPCLIIALLGQENNFILERLKALGFLSLRGSTPKEIEYKGKTFVLVSDKTYLRLYQKK